MGAVTRATFSTIKSVIVSISLSLYVILLQFIKDISELSIQAATKMLGKGNLLLHGGKYPEELTYFNESRAEMYCSLRVLFSVLTLP